MDDYRVVLLVAAGVVAVAGAVADRDGRQGFTAACVGGFALLLCFVVGW